MYLILQLIYLRIQQVLIKEAVSVNIERLVYGWRKIMENITRGYGHHE